MDQLLVTTAKLVPYPKRGGSVVNLATSYHYEATPAEAELGDLCSVVEVLAPPKQAAEVTNLILSTAQRTYYEPSAMEPAERFEAAVKAINRELASYATRGNSAWIGKVSAVVSAITGSWVHVTQTGSAHGFLYRGGRDTCITTGLTSKEPHRPSKTFGNIASGQLHSGDRLMLSTPALLHQLSSQQLTEIVCDNSAAAGIAKLQQLLATSDAQERIAVTISQVNTAEAAAMVPQSGLPKEAHLGKPAGLAQTAKGNAAPIAKNALGLAVGSGQWLKTTYEAKVGPNLKRGTLGVVKFLRKRLANRNSRVAVVVALVVIAGLIFWGVSRGGQNKALAALAGQYKDAYTKESTAATQLANGDKLGAKTNYEASLGELNSVIKNPKAPQLTAYLTKHSHADADPLSASKLRDIVSSQIDQIDGLTKVNPGQLADFSALGDAKPTLMQQVGNQFIFVDPSSGSSIYRYDQSKAKLEVVATHPKGLGKVIAITASSNQDGVYLLTDQPAVWFYALADSSLKPLTIAGGSWPKGQAIASYAGNLYVLLADDSALDKITPAGNSSFNAPIASPINDPSVLKNAQTLAIDGSIYIGSNKGFTRVFAGVVQQSDLVFPTNLMHPRDIVSSDAGKLLITTDADSNRIGLFNFDGALEYSRQIEITGSSTVYAASSTEDNVLYALVDQKFVKVSY